MLAAKAPDQTLRQPLGRTAPPKVEIRHRRDAHAKKSSAKSPGQRIKDQEPKKSKNVDRAKATVDLKPCRHPEGFAGLLRALNLSSRCET